MSNVNRALWDRVCKTDPKHVKPITGKQYSGNSPKPYYIVERLTEEFGPCGKGWGFTVLSERMERLSDHDVLHIAHVRFWYLLEGSQHEFDQMGQTKAAYMTSKGSLLVDEDAPKKSVTDALVKCASYLGFAGDIFSGRWDDSKYVAELRKEFADQPDELLMENLRKSVEFVEKQKEAHSPAKLAFESLQPEVQQAFRKAAPHITDAMPDCAKAIDLIDMALDNWPDEDRQNLKAGLWHLLDSKTRSAIKRHAQITAMVPA